MKPHNNAAKAHFFAYSVRDNFNVSRYAVFIHDWNGNGRERTR